MWKIFVLNKFLNYLDFFLRNQEKLLMNHDDTFIIKVIEKEGQKWEKYFKEQVLKNLGINYTSDKFNLLNRFLENNYFLIYLFLVYYETERKKKNMRKREIESL